MPVGSKKGQSKNNNGLATKKSGIVKFKKDGGGKSEKVVRGEKGYRMTELDSQKVNSKKTSPKASTSEYTRSEKEVSPAAAPRNKRVHSELQSEDRFAPRESSWDNYGGEEEGDGDYDPNEGFPSVSRQGNAAAGASGENKKRSKSGGFESMGFSYPVYKGIKQKGCVPPIVPSVSCPIDCTHHHLCAATATPSHPRALGGHPRPFPLPALRKMLHHFFYKIFESFSPRASPPGAHHSPLDLFSLPVHID